MFDFEEWSEKIYRLIEYMQQHELSHEEELKYQEELTMLWDELLQQENDEYVQFLKQLLSMTKEVMNGERESTELEDTVDKMREITLEK